MTSLRQCMIEDMQVRNLAPNTQQGYVRQVSLFARYFHKSPELLEPEQIRAYLVYLANEKKLSRSTIVIATSALRFLYKVTLKRNWSLEEVIPVPKKPQKLPVILSPEEVRGFLDCVQGRKHRAILSTCYAAGLRLSEVVALTPSCVTRFMQQPGAAAKLAEFQKIESWKQREFIEAGGWATPGGGKEPNSGVATACADELAKTKT